MFPQRRRRGGNFGLLMLGASLFRIGIDKVPPITLAFVAINTGIFMRLLPNLPRVLDACVSNDLVFKDKQYIRLLLASFYHLDDMHLYYNMASFIYKGVILEPKLGAKKYFISLMTFALSSQVLLLILNMVAANVLGNRSYTTTCAAGFSAVLFALKVLVQHYSSGERASFMGIPINIPAKYAFWVELLVIQIMVPNASFTGHLAGILVGLAYVKGPLKTFVNAIDGITSGHAPVFNMNAGPSCSYRSGTTGRNDGYPPPPRTRRQLDTDERELQEALRRSINDYEFKPQVDDTRSQFQAAPSYGWSISDEEDTAPYPTSTTNTLYPNLPSAPYPPPSAPHHPEPSAPPFSAASSPMHQQKEDNKSEAETETRKDLTHEEIRQIRLRKFTKQ